MGGIQGRDTYSQIQQRIKEYQNQDQIPEGKVWSMIAGAVAGGLTAGATNHLALAYGMKGGAEKAAELYDTYAPKRREIRYEDVYGPTAVARRNLMMQSRQPRK